MTFIINKYSKILIVVLLGLFLFLGIFSLKDDSITVDEIIHIPAGYSYLKFNDYRLNPEHPPLIKLVSAIPLLFMHVNFPTKSSFWSGNHETNWQWFLGRTFIYDIGNNLEKIVFFSRLIIFLLSLILGIYVYKWASELYGKNTGLVALTLFVLEPNIMAHSRYVTTDMGITIAFFVAIYYFYKFLNNICWKYIIICGILFGIIQLVKFSGIILLFYILFLTLIFILVYPNKIINTFSLSKCVSKEWVKRGCFFITSITTICLIGYILVGIIYEFTIYKMPIEIQHQIINETPIKQSDKHILNTMTNIFVLRPYAYYIFGLKMVFAKLNGSSPTFFLGEIKKGSWWYYYPMVFLIKTSIPLLISIFISFWYFTSRIIQDYFKKLYIGKLSVYKKIKKIIWDNFPEFIMITAIIIWFIAGIKSNLNIGLRHILPIYPFIFVLCAKYLVLIFNKRHSIKNYRYLSYVKKVAIVVLIVWMIISNFIKFPHYISYFNEFIGSNSNGFKYVVDSNLEWGQDVKRFANWVEENNIPIIIVSGQELEHAASYCKNKENCRIKIIDYKDDFPDNYSGFIAISATQLKQKTKWYEQNNDISNFTSLEQYKPVEIIGNSILIYNISPIILSND